MEGAGSRFSQECYTCPQTGVRGGRAAWCQDAHAVACPAAVLHPSALQTPDCVCSAPIRERDHLQASALEQTWFLSGSPESLFLSEAFLGTGHDSRLKQFTLVVL